MVLYIENNKNSPRKVKTDKIIQKGQDIKNNIKN
jgi:hypothetical protein